MALSTFYIKGNKVDELVGANTGELETKLKTHISKCNSFAGM
jgi:hypothetical protein